MKTSIKTNVITLVLLLVSAIPLKAQQNKDTGITALVKLDVKSADLVKVKNAILDNIHVAWTEAGNYKLELYEAKDAPTTLYLFERWKNQEALAYHVKQMGTQNVFSLLKTNKITPQQVILKDLWPLPVKKQKHKAHVTLMVQFEIKKGAQQSFVKLFEPFVQSVRKEPGNLEFHFHQVKGSNTSFVLYERWEKQSDLDLHMTLETTKNIVNNFKNLLAKPLNESIIYVNDISE